MHKTCCIYRKYFHYIKFPNKVTAACACYQGSIQFTVSSTGACDSPFRSPLEPLLAARSLVLPARSALNHKTTACLKNLVIK